jgi:hypothetical protein
MTRSRVFPSPALQRRIETIPISTITLTTRSFYRRAVGALVATVAVVTALLLPAGMANAAPPVRFTVTSPAVPTAIALATAPAPPVVQGTRVTLTATIVPMAAAGIVQFKDRTTNLGGPVTVSKGVASASPPTLAVGSHQLTAVFTPSNPAAFDSSTSPPIRFTVTAPR